MRRHLPFHFESVRLFPQVFLFPDVLQWGPVHVTPRGMSDLRVDIEDSLGLKHRVTEDLFLFLRESISEG